MARSIGVGRFATCRVPRVDVNATVAVYENEMQAPSLISETKVSHANSVTSVTKVR